MADLPHAEAATTQSQTLHLALESNLLNYTSKKQICASYLMMEERFFKLRTKLWQKARNYYHPHNISVRCVLIITAFRCLTLLAHFHI